MIEFTDQQEPIHHITITRGSEKTHFWYFLASPDVKLFDGTLDKKFVELLHVESSKLNIGEHVLFTSQAGYMYNVGRMDAKNYSVQSLSAA